MDRQQNINIKFNTNNVDLQKASELLAKAKLANDQLNASIQKTGTEGKQAVTQFSNTIEGLKLQMQQLKAQIDLTNQADKTRLDQLRGQYAAMDAQLKQYQGTLKQTQDVTKSVADSLGGLYSAVRIALTAGLIRETFNATIEMAKLKGQVDGVTRAFNALPNATLLMADLRAKTHGTLDELTLMQKAVQAKNFKIPLEQLGTLLEFAAIKAQQTGLDINYLVNSLITGLGRNSIRLLDNLQISVTELRAKTKELGSTQAAVFAIVSKQMQDMGGFLETDATRVDKLDAAWKNLKITLSERFASGGLIDVLTKAAEGGSMLFGGSARFADAQRNAIEAVKQFKIQNDGILDSDKKIQQVELELDKLRKRRLEDGAKLVSLQAEADKSSFLGTKEENQRAQLAQEQVKSISMRNDVTAATIILLEQYRKSLSLTNVDDKEQLGLIEQWEKRLNEINDEIKQSTDVSGKQQKALYDEGVELKRLIKIYSDFDDEMKHTEITSKSLREEIDKQVQAIADQLNKTLKSPTKGQVPVGGFQGPIGPGDLAKEGMNTDSAIFKTWYANYATFWDKLKQGFDDLGVHIHKGTEQTVEDQRRNWKMVAREITDGLTSIFKDQLNSFSAMEVNELDKRLTAIQDFYDKQIELAGDNQVRASAIRTKEQQEIAKLQRDKARAERKQAQASIIINTAASIVKALVEAPWPYDLVLAAIYGAMGASQLSVLNRAPQGYAKGVIDIQGPGTSTSDSIPTKLSKGESVMTAEETRSNLGLLKAIRSRKINDKMLNEIIAKSGGVQGNALDSGAIIAAIKSQPKPPDYFRVGATIYEAKKIDEKSKLYVRRGFLG